MKKNPDKEVVLEIREALKKNNGYCPCMFEKNQDTKCPCKQCRENNICVCGLFIAD